MTTVKYGNPKQYPTEVNQDSLILNVTYVMQDNPS